MPHTEWSHHCSACGKCCNSPPELSLPELFHHQRVFFGTLAVWQAPERLEVTVQGVDLGLGCPALDSAGRCALHFDRKPTGCSVVPFDARRPDSEQHLILAQRSADAHRFGSDCLVPGEREGFALVTRHLTVVDSEAHKALQRRRAELADERRFWSNAVAAQLSAAGLSAPSTGFISLSLAPALLHIAGASPRVRERCVQFLEAQLALAARLNGDTQLIAFARTHERLHALLRAAPSPLPSSESRAIERWLGLSENP